jgi:hypothetical protein
MDVGKKLDLVEHINAHFARETISGLKVENQRLRKENDKFAQQIRLLHFDLDHAMLIIAQYKSNLKTHNIKIG